MRDSIKCCVKIVGIEDAQIEVLLQKTHNTFRMPSLKEKIKFEGQGIIFIEGKGYDNRCAFCHYLREIVINDFVENEKKGSIEFINCPFNADKTLNYTREVKKARKDLIDMFLKLGNKNRK